MTVEISEVLEKLTLEKHPPVNLLTLELGEDNSIKGSLEFDYDGEVVPYGKLAEKTPYVTIKKPEEDLIYWVKRNITQEENAYKTLLKYKFMPMQTNNLSAGMDDAIDFYNLYAPQMSEKWKIVEPEGFSALKAAEYPLKIHAKIDFAESVDSFILEISCAVEKTRLT